MPAGWKCNQWEFLDWFGVGRFESCPLALGSCWTSSRWYPGFIWANIWGCRDVRHWHWFGEIKPWSRKLWWNHVRYLEPGWRGTGWTIFFLWTCCKWDITGWKYMVWKYRRWSDTGWGSWFGAVSYVCRCKGNRCHGNRIWVWSNLFWREGPSNRDSLYTVWVRGKV